MAPTQLTDSTDLPSDALVRWGAQGMRSGVRAWRDGDAVVVACPDLSRRHRLVVHGTGGRLLGLVRHALAIVGRDYRPIGDDEAVTEVVAEFPDIALLDRFWWMDTVHPTEVVGTARWLTDDATDEVRTLIDSEYPGSYAQPGGTGVRRWAGVRDESGELVAVAAEAWSAPEVGFLAGVITAPAARGRGHAIAVCGLTIDTLVAETTRAALMVDSWNDAARTLYTKLGLTSRPIAAAAHRACLDQPLL
ncbi:RimJ/RimL family protein N-acetyltransferase [Actinokineospora baliensis]|uniref:GNAT family N-acetyltransferase n=1 Tax=Actinokineospora baliensis TaxID=547056 RepID=UPI001957B08C|nr:GNAT family N-acetyltransferase [Actinokineospora baliensis]MBM7773130.1 RimJ/RimL family protein N-acetyltransferase [Actinokineospora baliensis]